MAEFTAQGVGHSAYISGFTLNELGGRNLTFTHHLASQALCPTARLHKNCSPRQLDSDGPQRLAQGVESREGWSQNGTWAVGLSTCLVGVRRPSRRSRLMRCTHLSRGQSGSRASAQLRVTGLHVVRGVRAVIDLSWSTFPEAAASGLRMGQEAVGPQKPAGHCGVQALAPKR